MLKKKERQQVARQIRRATGIKLPEAANIARAIVGGRILEACETGVLQAKCPSLVVAERAADHYNPRPIMRAGIYVDGPRGSFTIREAAL